MENFLLTKEKRLGSLSILYVIVEVGLCLFLNLCSLIWNFKCLFLY